jgi:hypothetical protein
MVGSVLFHRGAESTEFGEGRVFPIRGGKRPVVLPLLEPEPCCLP